MNNAYAAWIEEENGRLIQVIAGPVTIDKMAAVEEKTFRERQLQARAREFTARSIFEFVMQEKAS